jgi:ribulose-phosphate 3-epimerase
MTNEPIEIIPAVLPKSWDDLKNHLELVRGVTRHVQIDIVDGHFAHGKTWPYKDGDMFAKIVEQEHGLPFWEELDFEFDLMVQDPAEVVLNYVHAGASRIVVHAASKTAVHAVQQLIDLNEDTGAFSVQVGVAIGALENPDLLEQFEEQYDFVQVMGIERIGRQGEEFSQKALFLLERLRRRYPHLPLQVDGGLRLENATALVAAGATRLVAGSAIFGTDDVPAAYKALYTGANAQ